MPQLQGGLCSTRESSDVSDFMVRHSGPTLVEFFDNPWRALIVQNGSITLDDGADEFRSVSISGSAGFIVVGCSDGIKQIVVFPDCTPEQFQEALMKVRAQLGRGGH